MIFPMVQVGVLVMAMDKESGNCMILGFLSNVLLGGGIV
jgi:hypothetical protein